MKRIAGMVVVAMVLGGVSACSSLNVNLGGVAGGVNMGANIDPINKNIGANADKSFSAGGTETSVGASTGGVGVDVDADVQHDFDQQ